MWVNMFMGNREHTFDIVFAVGKLSVPNKEALYESKKEESAQVL